MALSNVEILNFGPTSKLVGNTPLIRLSHKLYAKLETYNPTGSVKDRMAQFVLKRALARGDLIPGMTIVAATSGNTGISISAFGAMLGCPVKIIMPCNMSEERKQMMRAYGAEIIEVGESNFAEAIEKREEILKTHREFWSPRQFSNLDNIDCHKLTTGPEIASQIPKGEELSAFIHGAGTGGTIMGVIKYFDVDPIHDPKFVLVAPKESSAAHGIQGINDGEDFLLDKSLIDEEFLVSTESAIKRAKRMAREEGLLVGISSGANVYAAEKWIKRNKPEGIVITVLCDRGERYMSIY